MKKFVYLGVLSLVVLPLLNCAPKDKLLRKPNTKDPEVAQLEVANVQGLDYTYYLTVRAAEAKQLIELALQKEIKQPADACVEVIPQNELNGKETFKIVSQCAYESGDYKIGFDSSESFIVEKDQKGVLYNVYLHSIGSDAMAMLPKDRNDKSKSVMLSPITRDLTVSALFSDREKGEQVFDVTYKGELNYEQTIMQGKLSVIETGVQTYILEGKFRLSASGVWTIEEPNFELDIKATRVLTNKKKKNEKVTPKTVDLNLVLKPVAAKKGRTTTPLAFVGDCDRLAGQMNIGSYDHKTTEKGFSGLLSMGANSMKVEKSQVTRQLPACEKSMGGYNIQPPVDLIYLK